MTAQGAALTRYRRAIETQSIVLAELAAREMGHVPLSDALSLVMLYAVAGSPKAEPSAVRWLGRLAADTPNPSPTDFSDEPGVYLECEMGYRIEDIGRIDAEAGLVECLTRFPRDVIALPG